MSLGGVKLAPFMHCQLSSSFLLVQVNWGRAMCIRAELADSQDVAVQLYGSALDKFEAVLEEDPSMAMAKYR